MFPILSWYNLSFLQLISALWVLSSSKSIKSFFFEYFGIYFFRLSITSEQEPKGLEVKQKCSRNHTSKQGFDMNIRIPCLVASFRASLICFSFVFPKSVSKTHAAISPLFISIPAFLIDLITSSTIPTGSVLLPSDILI